MESEESEEDDGWTVFFLQILLSTLCQIVWRLSQRWLFGNSLRRAPASWYSYHSATAEPLATQLPGNASMD